MLKFSLMSFVAVMAFCPVGVAQTASSAGVLGTWEGESICTVRPSACHDEHVIYQITQDEQKKISVSADKVVNGERQNMGVLECTYDGKALTCPFPKGVWSFSVTGSKMNGGLKLADGTLFRKVDVEKKQGK